MTGSKHRSFILRRGRIENHPKSFLMFNVRTYPVIVFKWFSEKDV